MSSLCDKNGCFMGLDYLTGNTVTCTHQMSQQHNQVSTYLQIFVEYVIHPEVIEEKQMTILFMCLKDAHNRGDHSEVH